MSWAVATVFLNAFAQIVLKFAANQTKTLEDVLPAWWQYSIALLAYGLSVVTWVMALRVLPLSAAYPLMALAFILVPIAGMTIFKESITMPQWGFLILLVFSIVGFALTSDHSDS